MVGTRDRAAVRRRQLDAFVGYRTSALALGSAVDVVSPPSELSVTATYGLVMLQPGPVADGFAEALSGPTGRAVLASHGFDPPEPV